MATLIPLQAIPAQTFSTTTDAGDTLKISLYSRSTGLFADVACNGVDVARGVQCVHGGVLVKSPYLGMVGNLLMLDLQGTEDPQVSGLGTRWVMAYDVQL